MELVYTFTKFRKRGSPNGEMVLDSFNLNRPGMIIFRPIMIIRKVKENIIYKSDFGI